MKEFLFMNQHHFDTQQQVYTSLCNLCHNAHLDDDFLSSFWQALIASNDIYEEFLYYVEHQDFLGHANVHGYTVIDILVWQIDHFKSHMDRGEYDYQSNPSFMVLMAFDTLLKMQKNPASYLLALQTETGTDYAEKY